MAQVTIVSSHDGDWEAVYGDGFLLCEGHSVDAVEALRAFRNATIEDVSTMEVDYNKLPAGSIGFPGILGAIPEKARI